MRKQMTREQLLETLKDGSIRSLGFRKAWIEGGEVDMDWKWGWFDLRDGDSNPEIIGDRLFLQLWSNIERLPDSVVQSGVIETKQLNDPILDREITFCKYIVLMNLGDVEYLDTKEDRTFIEIGGEAQ